jgi:hypothetical protein
MTDSASHTSVVDDCPRQLARCQRLTHDLEAQLRHAVAEQTRIRQTLQARLTEVTVASEQERQVEAGRLAAAQAECAAQLHAALSDAAATAASQAAAIAKQTDELQQARDAAAQLKLKKDQVQLVLESRLEAAAAERRAVEADWQSRHAAALQALAVRETELHGIYQSLSWRLSAPLRGLSRLLRRRRRT